VYLFWWHGKQKIESNTTGYRLVKTNRKTEGGNQWLCDNQKSVG
jgi:hypothetical protein